MYPILQSIKNAVVRYLNVKFQLFGAPYVAGGTFDTKLIAPAYKVANIPAGTVENKIHWKFALVSTVSYPATFITTLANGRVWGHEGIVISSKNQLFNEVSRHYNEQGKALQLFTQRIRKPVYYDAKVAVLAAAGSHVYYHWMLDILPRVALLQEAGLFDSIDYFVVEYLKLGFQTELLQKLGIDTSRIIASNDPYSFHLQARELVVPSLVSPNDAPSKEACLFIRNLFKKERSTRKPYRRLYIQRKKGRKIVNEQELSDFLLAKGFEVVQAENMSVAQQVHLFSEAQFVVAPHGAGLTNLVFCEPGTKVIDIFSPEWVNPCYWILSSHLHLQYNYLIGEGEAVPEYHDPLGKTTDIIVSMSKFIRLMERINNDFSNELVL